VAITTLNKIAIPLTLNHLHATQLRPESIPQALAMQNGVAMKTTAISPHRHASHKGSRKTPETTYPHPNLLKRLESARQNWVRNGFEIGFFGFEIGFIGSEIGFFGFENGAFSTALCSDRLMFGILLDWRCGSGSNRRIWVLQTQALPLGYRTGDDVCEELLFLT
jgi:hypothetical protein